MSRTVIVFKEDCILAAAGREGRYPGIEKVEQIRLSGTGDAFARWQEGLSKLPKSWRSAPVRLVLPVNLCSARVLKLPYAKGKQLADMASKELADSFRNEIADYSLLSGDKRGGVEICAGGVDAGQLEAFEGICREEGFTVGGATVPMEGYLRVLRQLGSYQNGTAIYLFFEEGSMTSVLGQEGHYLYSGRSRLFSEPGTLDFGTEIVRSISGILQFHASSKNEVPITDVYYAGCPEADFEVGVEGIGALGLNTAPLEPDGRISLPADQAAGDWIPCIGAMTWAGKNDRQIDLYRESRKREQKTEGPKALWKHLAVPLAVLVLCLVPALVLWVMNLEVGREIGKLQDWIESGEVQEQYGRALELKARLAQIQGGIAAVRQTEENLAGYPQFTADLLHRIENTGGSGIACTITGYDASTGVLTFEASSREIIDVPAYVLKLEDSGLFHYVEYLGYAFEDDWYTLMLSCTLEGRDPQRGETE